MKLLHDSLTEADGVSYGLVRLLGMLLVLVFIGLAVASFVMNRPFDLVAFGTASGLVMASLGAAIKMAEPPTKPQEEPKP